MTTPHTNVSILEAAGISTTNLEFPELEVPVLTGNQRQGDVLVLRVPDRHGGSPMGAGVTVVAVESSQANTHVLLGDGTWEANAGYESGREPGLVQGWLTVPDGGEAFLIHTDEHNALGFGPGTYEIRRQREYTNEWRTVED